MMDEAFRGRRPRGLQREPGAADQPRIGHRPSSGGPCRPPPPDRSRRSRRTSAAPSSCTTTMRSRAGRSSGGCPRSSRRLHRRDGRRARPGSRPHTPGWSTMSPAFPTTRSSTRSADELGRGAPDPLDPRGHGHPRRLPRGEIDHIREPPRGDDRWRYVQLGYGCTERPVRPPRPGSSASASSPSARSPGPSGGRPPGSAARRPVGRGRDRAGHRVHRRARLLRAQGRAQPAPVRVVPRRPPALGVRGPGRAAGRRPRSDRRVRTDRRPAAVRRLDAAGRLRRPGAALRGAQGPADRGGPVRRGAQATAARRDRRRSPSSRRRPAPSGATCARSSPDAGRWSGSCSVAARVQGEDAPASIVTALGRVERWIGALRRRRVARRTHRR